MHTKFALIIIFSRTVCLGVKAPLTTLKSAKNQFRNVTNLFVVPLDLDTIFRWTPIQDWWSEDFKYVIKDAPWRTIHLADALRWAAALRPRPPGGGD
jgi:hypothetical protein